MNLDSNNQMLDNRRIIFLDYLRIFAFVSVLVGHKFYRYAISDVINERLDVVPKFILELLLPLVKGGGAGVVVFFLVSGYIITHVLQTEQPICFAIKRLFRIYPLYIVAVLLQVASKFYTDSSVPDLSVLILQLLLIGDFFNTPYTLGGVEWTLRVEIIFYLFMGTLRYYNLLHKHKKKLPWILITTTLLLGILPPIPALDIWSKGYFTIYVPFLFLGVFFYLKEKRQVGFKLLLVFIFLVLFQYYYLISVYQPKWTGDHFAVLALILFLLLWRYRTHLLATSSVLFFSDLTYSVYLFHNWVWNPIKKLLNNFSLSDAHQDLQVLFILFLLCFFMLKLVEKPGVMFGEVVLRYLRNKPNKTIG